MPGTQALLRDRLRHALLFRELTLRAAGRRSLAQSFHFPGSQVSAVEADVQEGLKEKGRRSNSCLKVPVTLAMSTVVLKQPPGENTPLRASRTLGATQHRLPNGFSPLERLLFYSHFFSLYPKVSC